MSAGSADLAQLAADFASAAGEPMHQAAVALLQDAAIQVQENAQAYSPKKTMRLERSITITYQFMSATIGPTASYGVYQEFGTATRGEFGGQPYVIVPVRANKLAFKINGKWVFTKKVVHPGIPPHPFMRPALMNVVTPFGDSLAQLGVAMIVTGPHHQKAVAA